MAYEVGTDHRVIAFGDDRMVLFDSDSGKVIVSAARSTGSKFIVHVENTMAGIADVEADDRSTAITAMTELAYQVLGPNPNPVGGDGYSTLVPRGLAETP